MIANNFSNLYIKQMNCILQLTVTLGEFWITFIYLFILDYI